MTDKGSDEDSGGRSRQRICGTTGIAAMEIREGGYGGGGDAGRQQKRCGTADIGDNKIYA